MDYYKEKHFRLLRERLGSNLKKDEIHEVLDGPYVAYCQMYFDSIEDFQAADGPARRRGHGPTSPTTPTSSPSCSSAPPTT